MKSFKKCFFANKSCKKRVRQNKNPLFKRVFLVFGGDSWCYFSLNLIFATII
nr:MAG TPA: hypothetical protein [Caudoviricetes sp.]